MPSFASRCVLQPMQGCSAWPCCPPRLSIRSIPPCPLCRQVLPDLSEERWQYAGTEIFKETGETARVWEWDLTGGSARGGAGSKCTRFVHAAGRPECMGPPSRQGMLVIGYKTLALHQLSGAGHRIQHAPTSRNCLSACPPSGTPNHRGRRQRDEVPVLRHPRRRAAAPVDDGHQPVLGWAGRGLEPFQLSWNDPAGWKQAATSAAMIVCGLHRTPMACPELDTPACRAAHAVPVQAGTRTSTLPRTMTTSQGRLQTKHSSCPTE